MSLVTTLCCGDEHGTFDTSCTKSAYSLRKTSVSSRIHHVGRFMFWALLGRKNYIVGCEILLRLSRKSLEEFREDRMLP